MAPRLITSLGHVTLKIGPERFGATVAFYIDSLQFLPDVGDVSGDLLSSSASAAVLAASTARDDDADDAGDDDSDASDEAAGGQKAKASASQRRGRWLIHPTAGVRLFLDRTSHALAEIAFISDQLEDIGKILTTHGIAWTGRHHGGVLQEVQAIDPAGNTVLVTSVPATGPALLLTAGPQVASTTTAAKRKTIAVLTSGGDSAGMNAALRGIVRAAIATNCDIYAIHEGYQGMVDGTDEMIHKFQWRDVTGIIGEGGTVIGTARSKEFRTPEGRLKAAYNMITRNIDALVCIGGDGSLTGANLFRKEWPAMLKTLVADARITQAQADAHPVFSVVGLVGSIDNDMCGTDMTIGCDTALHRVMESLDSLASTAASHQRAFVVEVMGRHCGWLALWAALAAGADWLFIPEAPPEGDDWKTSLCTQLAKIKSTGKRRLLVIVAEGAITNKGEPIQADAVRAAIETNVHIEARTTVLGHTQRGGTASYYDRCMATLQGVDAVEAVLAMTPDSPSPMIGISGNAIVRLPLVDCVEQTLSAGKALEERRFAQAMELRGREFVEAHRTFLAISNAAEHRHAEHNPETEKTFRLGIVHVGAPAAGMNSATRAAARLALGRGHTVLGIENGFKGLMNGEVKQLSWMDVDDWAAKGGSKLGTARTVPEDDLGMIAMQMQQFRLEALMIIGGFEAFLSMGQLLEHRSQYPQFGIPMILLPATISNNVPGTEISLGTDTSLNIIVQSCDEIKQSASSTTRRVFIVEVMGGKCGFLATMSALAAAATRAYIPEKGITFSDLAEDITQLKRKFSMDRNVGRIILRAEDSSNTYTTDFIAKLLDEEGTASGLFDARSTNLGHLQQGGLPSPLDRYNGARWAGKAVEYLEAQVALALARTRVGAGSAKTPTGGIRVFTSDPDTAAVIGYHKRELVITPIRQLLPRADIPNRRPREQWWTPLGRVLRLLASYD